MMTLSTQLVTHEQSGKHRVLLQVQKDDQLDLSIVLTGAEAEKLATDLLEQARQARGKNIIIPFSPEA